MSESRTAISARRWYCIVAIALWCAASLFGGPSSLQQLRESFTRPPADSRIMVRWWWFGPAVSHASLERDMRMMKESGIGGFEVQPVYPVDLTDNQNGLRILPFLSDDFLASLRFTADKAHELGLRMDLTLGSGWPYGGPHIEVDHAAGMLRREKTKVAAGSRRVPLPSLEAGETFLGAFAAESTRALGDIHDGALWLPKDDPAQAVWFFVASRTGMMVKRPSVGAEGFVLDHYDRVALDTHLHTVGDRLMSAFGQHKPYAIFCDSLEVFGSDWTAGFLDEFRERRGYDLKPLLPALYADVAPQAAKVRHDRALTLTELLEERFLKPLSEWSRRNGVLFRIQGYGTPPATISSNVYADLPEGEGSHWRRLTPARWSSSASHLLGKPVTSSETWTWLHSPSFRATPLDVKAEADLHFLQGINQLIGHGWPSTPESVPNPGYRFYAAAAFTDRNPWWIAMPDVSLYLQRLSHVLRLGDPVADVALYLPVADARAGMMPGRTHLLDSLAERVGEGVVGGILDAGFSFDAIDDGILKTGKNTVFDTKNGFKIVILPSVFDVPESSRKALNEFARNGGIVIATGRIPEGVTARLVERDSDLASVLRTVHQPDAVLPQGVGFVHRRMPFADVYFVANTTNDPRSFAPKFRAQEKAEVWNPLTDEVAALEAEINLEPYGSRVVVFSRDSRLRGVPTRDGAPIEISGNWTVTIGNRAPESWSALRSWTDDETTRYFSGTATYERDVEVPADLLRQRVRLQFGEGTKISGSVKNGMRAWMEGPVREAAVVYVNGERAGSVWCPPYAVDVTKHLRPGTNRLRIVAGNLAINELAGQTRPNYRLLNRRFGVRFEPQDMENLNPLPSGLVGTVALVPQSAERDPVSTNGR